MSYITANVTDGLGCSNSHPNDAALVDELDTATDIEGMECNISSSSSSSSSYFDSVARVS